MKYNLLNISSSNHTMGVRSLYLTHLYNKERDPTNYINRPDLFFLKIGYIIMKKMMFRLTKSFNPALIIKIQLSFTF